MRTLLRTSTAFVALVSAASLSLSPALAQDASGSGSATEQSGAASDAQSGASDEAQPDGGGQTGGESGTADDGDAAAQGTPPEIDPEKVVASVDGTDITQGDILTAVQSLPPQAQQMPPQLVYQIVLGQLVTRELILQEAKDQGIEPSATQESEAASASDGEGGAASNDRALIVAFIEQEMEGKVTDEKIEQAYAIFQEQNPEAEQTMDELRPQLEQQVRQEAMQEITQNLREDAEIVLYDQDGNPVEPTPAEPDGGDGSGAGAPDADSGSSSDTGSDAESSATDEGAPATATESAPSDQGAASEDTTNTQ